MKKEDIYVRLGLVLIFVGLVIYGKAKGKLDDNPPKPDFAKGN